MGAVEEQAYHNPLTDDASTRPSSTLIGLCFVPLLKGLHVTSPYGLDAFDARWYAGESERRWAASLAWTSLLELAVQVPRAPAPGVLATYGRMPRLFDFPRLIFFKHDQLANNFAGEDFTNLTRDEPAGSTNPRFYPQPYVLEYMTKVPRKVRDLVVRWGSSSMHLQSLFATKVWRRAVLGVAKQLKSIHYIGWEMGDSDDEVDDDMDDTDDDDMDEDDD
jgi:hypothetical protein